MTSWQWEAFGMIGQFFFGSRFIVQWLASERAGKSVVPIAFWWLSIGGSAILLVYAIHIQSLTFILGQSLGFGIYIRNLVLLRDAAGANLEPAK